MPVLTPAPVAHPSHTLNRVAKAARVVRFIRSNPRIFGNDLDVGTVANFGPEVWALVNECMGEPRPMSQETICTAVGILAVEDVK